MLAQENRRVWIFLILLHIFLWIFFGVLFFGFQDVFSWSDPAFHVFTPQDTEMASRAADAPYQKLANTVTIVKFVAIGINWYGLVKLGTYSSRTDQHLHSFKKWMKIIPLLALLLYFMCFYYIKYEVDYFRLWMQLVPQMFFSATDLLLTAILFRGLFLQCHADQNQ